MKTMLLAAAAIAATPGSSLPGRPLPADWVETLPIERMCRPAGALTYEFGSLDIPRQPVPADLLPLTLPGSYAPFEKVSLKTTKWSGKFYSASYGVEFAATEEARAAASAMAARFEAAGWIAPRSRDLSVQWELYSEPEAPTRSSRLGTRVTLLSLGKDLTLSCTSLPLEREYIEEEFGNLAPSAPKPVRPESPLPAGATAESCDDPAARTRVLARSSNDLNSLSRHIVERMGFAEHMIVWKLQRLSDSGKLSIHKIREMVQTPGSPFVQKRVHADIELLIAMYDDLDVVAAGKHDAESCRALIAMFGKLVAVTDATEPQWKALEAAIDREAARVGVSLD